MGQGYTDQQLLDGDFLTRQQNTIVKDIELFPNSTGNLPTANGELNAYAFDASKVTGSQGGVPRVIYVNGMQTHPGAHRQAALYLSWVVKRWVTGIYVKQSAWGLQGNDAGIQDSLRKTANELCRNPNCPPDIKTMLNHHILHSMDIPPEMRFTVASFLGDLSMCLKEHDAELGDQSVEYAKKLVREDPPALALYELLVDRYQNSPVHIVAHSRGNLVVSMALWAYGLAVGKSALKWINVYALASPSPVWPPVGWLSRYANTDDPITYVSSKDLTSVLAKLPIQAIAEKMLTNQKLTSAEYYQIAAALPSLNGLQDLGTYQPGRRPAENTRKDSGGYYGVDNYNEPDKLVWNHFVLLYMSRTTFTRDITGRL